MTMTREAFDNMVLRETDHNYNNFGLVSRQLLGLGVEKIPIEAE